MVSIEDGIIFNNGAISLLNDSKYDRHIKMGKCKLRCSKDCIIADSEFQMNSLAWNISSIFCICAIYWNAYKMSFFVPSL